MQKRRLSSAAGQIPLTDNGKGMGRGSRGKGHMGGNYPGSGPGGSFICPNCGEQVSHTPGEPCYTTICPQCGSQMMKE